MDSTTVVALALLFALGAALYSSVGHGGAVLGLLAGLTGTGGGIFLSPLIILMAWEEPRHTSGVVSAFILLNSAAGLAGNASAVGHLPNELPIFLAAVAAGALLGTWL